MNAAIRSLCLSFAGWPGGSSPHYRESGLARILLGGLQYCFCHAEIVLYAFSRAGEGGEEECNSD